MTKLLNLIIGSIALAGATAQECSSCILNPDMEWCHDAGGYCLEIGTGCTKTRATCTSSIDCDCSDCSSSYTCGATWEGEVVAHAYKRGTGCKTLDKPEVIQKTTKIKRMDDNRASCLFQTNTGSTEGSWTKWTCSDDVGGTATSERCNDEECMDCPNIPDVNTVTLVAGSGVCLANPDTTVTTGFDYMLIPPEGTGNARKNFENAMPICMRDITAPTPAPPPPAPTPTPATTCDACVQDDSMQWCWDDNRCAKPGESGCLGGPDVATCTNPVDCACSDCDNSAACGGPEPPPPAPETCEECQTVLRDMEWCWDSPRCLMVGSGCTESRATCINPTDCDCSDCANSFKCGAPWKTADSNYLYTYEYKTGSGCTEGKSTAATERTNVVKRMDNNRGSCVQNLVPGEGAYWTRYMCSAESGGTVTATRCSDDECQVCTGDDVVYDVVKVLANSQGVCIENKATDKAFMMTPPHNDMNFEDAIAPCLRNEAIPTPAPVPVAPTPSPARTCKECVALDNMEWCWDPPTGFGKDVLGERDDVGYCLKPGDGCHQSRATCSMPVDCDCSDCDNSGFCGGPGGTWIGAAEIYEYKPTSKCSPKDRTQSTPVGHVTKITRLGNPREMCAVEEDIKKDGQLSIAQNVKYTCDEKDDGSIMVTKTSCGASDNCGNCQGDVTAFSVDYNERGACLHGAGLLGAKESVQFELPMTTESGYFAAALAPCLLSPKLPPAPTPSGGKDSVGIGVGLGLGLPAVAAAGFFYHKRRTQLAASAGNDELLATSQAAGKAELGEMYSQL